MNRAERRAGRIRGPKGEWLYPMLLLVKERDARGRATECRVLYDNETVGDVLNAHDKNTCFLVWMTEFQMHGPS